MSSINIPTTVPDPNEPPYRGSYLQLLSENIGHRVTIEFMVGSCGVTSSTGIVIGASTQYVLLAQDNGTTVAGEMFAIKRITFL